MSKVSLTFLSMTLLFLVGCQSNESEPTPTIVIPTSAAQAAATTQAPPVADTANNRNALIAQSWQWLSFQGAAEAYEIQTPQSYILTPNPDGTINVQADCNNASGRFNADNTSLSIAIGPATLAACPGGSRSERFIQLLGGAARYFFDGGDLVIELMADGGNLRFGPAGTIAARPTVDLPTATPIPPTPVPPTPTLVPQLPGSVFDSGPRERANGTFQPPYYTVASGDTLYSIGTRFGVPYQVIAGANGLVNDAISAGRQLLITSGSDGSATNLPSQPPPPGSVVDSGPRARADGTFRAPYYAVAAGDTLYSIGQRFGVPYQQITAANQIGDNISAGQVLVIASGGGTANPPAGLQFERVNFPADSISTTLNEVIVQGQPQGYVLGGVAGQVLEIGTTSNGEALEVTVRSADGTLYALNGENSKVQNNLFLPLPANGDYYVTVRPVTLPENPNLAFTLTFIIQ